MSGRRNFRERDAEAGTLSIFVAICATMLLMLSGVVLDGGGRLRAYERADALAQEAARAGGQQIDRAALLGGQGLRLNPAAARKQIRVYLRANGITSPITITFEPTDQPTLVKVKFDTKYRTSLLAVVGIDKITVHGVGQARLVPGITAPAP